VRVLLISGEFAPMQGGVGDFTRELAKALVALGHEVFIFTHARACDSATTLPGYHLLPVVEKWGWGSWKAVLAAVAELRPDVVNLQYQAAAYGMHPAVNLLPWRLSRLRKRPTVVTTFHDLKVPYLFPKAGPLRWQSILALARWSDAVIVTNPEDEAILRPYSFIKKLLRIPIGSNIAVAPPPDYDRDAWRARWGAGPDTGLLVYFGFLNASKGGETLIRALHLLTTHPLFSCNPLLLMLGGQVGSSDPTNRAYLERVKALIAELGLNDRVRWTGYLPAPEVSAALLSGDVALPRWHLLSPGEPDGLSGPRAAGGQHRAPDTPAGAVGRGERAAGTPGRSGGPQ